MNDLHDPASERLADPAQGPPPEPGPQGDPIGLETSARFGNFPQMNSNNSIG